MRYQKNDSISFPTPPGAASIYTGDPLSGRGSCPKNDLLVSVDLYRRRDRGRLHSVLNSVLPGESVPPDTQREDMQCRGNKDEFILS